MRNNQNGNFRRFNDQDKSWNREKYTWILIGFLVIVIVGLIVFGSNGSDDNKILYDRIDELTEQSENALRRADSLEGEIAKYKEISKEFRRKDSLKNIQIEKQKAETTRLKRQQKIAKKDRERVEKELKEFKENPPKYSDDGMLPLLFDTKKRINNQKLNTEGDGDGNGN